MRGFIQIAFLIDMSESANRERLFRFFEKKLKEKDKYQSSLLKVSEFGIVQMTRKRSGKTLTQQLMNLCPMCKGHGHVKSVASIGFEILKHLKGEFSEKKKIKIRRVKDC